MEKLSSKMSSTKETIVFGGIILFIIYVLIGIIACISGSSNETGAMFSKFLSTTAMAGVCLLCLYDNLNKIANGNKAAVILATISLIALPFYLVIYCLSAWEVIQLTECVGTSYWGYCSQTVMNFLGKTTVILGSAVSLGTIGSMTMSINNHGRRTIDTAKSVATIFYTIAICLAVYLTLASSSILSFYGDAAAFAYTAVFSLLAWFCLTVLAVYISKFDNNYVAPTPIKPLNAKVITNSAPAVLTVEEAEEPAEKDPIYPEPIIKAPHHEEGESLHANPGEPLHELSDDDLEEHPVIGKATTSTEHPDDFEAFEKNEGEEEN